MLTREQLVGQHFLPFEEVVVPSLKGSVGVQGMTAGDALAYYKLVEKHSNGKGKGELDMESLAKLIVRCVVDEKRERVYTDDEWPEVIRWPNAAVQTVGRVCMRVNGNAVQGSAEGN